MSGASDAENVFAGVADLLARRTGDSRENLFQLFLGNQRQKQTLIELTNDGRLCHALLLTGPSGCGKRTFARLAAAAMLCESERKPCGVCSNCRKALGSVHPDVIALDCADTEHDGHKIDALRATVLDTVMTAPNEAARKVYILANVDMMSYGTPNALLKTLEEPPAHVCFVLTALSRERLMETILSRVFSVELTPLSDEDAAAALARRFPDVPSDVRQDAVAFSFGCLGEAEAILADDSRQELNRRARAAIQALAAGDEYALLAAMTLPDRKRENLRVLLRTVQLALREGLVKDVSGNGRDAASLTNGISSRVLAQTIPLFEEAAFQIDRNVNLNLIAARLAARAVGR